MSLEIMSKPGNSIYRDWESLLGHPLSEVSEIKCGRNSRVYRLIYSNGMTCAGKHYFHSSSDPRDRMRTELLAFELIRENGIENVPKIVAADFKKGLLVMEFIEGDGFLHVEKEDIDIAALFLLKLKKVSKRNIPDINQAKEAFFSACKIVENIALRLDKFKTVPYRIPLKDEFDYFLHYGIMPALDKYIFDACNILQRHNIPFEREIEKIDWTLSPSDFGFHNAIKRENGDIYFLDFEYFGWDDPAKTICDFLLHPAMNLDDKLKQHFIGSVLKGLDEGGSLRYRVEAYFPLFGLKWCLIMLNEFLPADLARRRFATSEQAGQEEVLLGQLKKSQKFFEELPDNYKKLKEILN